MGDANIQVFKSHSLFLKFYSILQKQTHQNRVAIFYNHIHLLEVNMAKKGGREQAEPVSRSRIWHPVIEISKMVENYTMQIFS